MIRCPCCNYLTITEEDEVIVDICPVCYWQYDLVSQRYPDRVISPNRVSLNEARNNYKSYGAVRRDVLQYVRPPLDNEI